MNKSCKRCSFLHLCCIYKATRNDLTISLLRSQACSEYAVCSPVELSRRSGVCVSGSRLTADEWSKHGLCAQPARVHGEKTGAGKERVKGKPDNRARNA